MSHVLLLFVVFFGRRFHSFPAVCCAVYFSVAEAISLVAVNFRVLLRKTFICETDEEIVKKRIKFIRNEFSGVKRVSIVSL